MGHSANSLIINISITYNQGRKPKLGAYSFDSLGKPYQQ